VAIQEERHAQVLRSHAPTLKQRDRLMLQRTQSRWRKAAAASPPPPRHAATPSERTPAAEACAPARKPYHVLLTATSQVYQKWQCRVMYFHWKKQRANDPAGRCTEMTGFSRLVATPGGRPDGLEGEIPSIFVREYDGAQLSRFQGYRVINRPYSVVQLLEKADVWRSIAEEYIYIAETDHILMHPIPNSAKRGSPMAYVFNYMGPNPGYADIIRTAWPEGGAAGYRQVQSIGPSPVIIHRKDLEAIAKPWEETAVALKTNERANAALGWVIEMWGYSIAAAKIGLRHQEFADFQVEPGALSSSSQLRGFTSRYWIFHYTYQFEYMLDGSPCKPWTIGEYSLDKRHFSDVYPVAPLPEPPKGANEAAFYLLRAFNEAMDAIPDWPSRQPSSGPPMQTLYGRRRLDWFSRHPNGFQTEAKTMPLVQSLLGARFSCSEVGSEKKSQLELSSNGDASGLQGILGRRGRWGSMNDPTLGPQCPVYSCLFIDFGYSTKFNAGYDKESKSLELYSDARPYDLLRYRCSRLSAS